MNDLPDKMLDAVRSLVRTKKPPVIPAGGALLWQWFVALSNTRADGMNGPQPISFLEISAWRSLMNMPVEPRHVVILRAMDNAYLAAVAQSRGGGLIPVSDHAMTADMFDAMFG